MRDIIDLLEEPLNDVIGIRNIDARTVATVSIAISMKRIADEVVKLSNADSARVAAFVVDIAKRVRDAEV